MLIVTSADYKRRSGCCSARNWSRTGARRPRPTMCRRATTSGCWTRPPCTRAPATRQRRPPPLLERFGPERVASAFIRLWRDGRPHPRNWPRHGPVAPPPRASVANSGLRSGSCYRSAIPAAPRRWLLPKICGPGTSPATPSARSASRPTRPSCRSPPMSRRISAEGLELEPGLTMRKLDSEPVFDAPAAAAPAPNAPNVPNANRIAVRTCRASVRARAGVRRKAAASRTRWPTGPPAKPVRRPALLELDAPRPGRIRPRGRGRGRTQAAKARWSTEKQAQRPARTNLPRTGRFLPPAKRPAKAGPTLSWLPLAWRFGQGDGAGVRPAPPASSRTKAEGGRAAGKPLANLPKVRGKARVAGKPAQAMTKSRSGRPAPRVAQGQGEARKPAQPLKSPAKSFTPGRPAQETARSKGARSTGKSRYQVSRRGQRQPVDHGGKCLAAQSCAAGKAAPPRRQDPSGLSHRRHRITLPNDRGATPGHRQRLHGGLVKLGAAILQRRVQCLSVRGLPAPGWINPWRCSRDHAVVVATILPPFGNDAGSPVPHPARSPAGP